MRGCSSIHRIKLLTRFLTSKMHCLNREWIVDNISESTMNSGSLVYLRVPLMPCTINITGLCQFLSERDPPTLSSHMLALSDIIIIILLCLHKFLQNRNGTICNAKSAFVNVIYPLIFVICTHEIYPTFANL